MAIEFFAPRPDVTPTIYAYELIGVDTHKDYIKIGYTERDAETRVREQLRTSALPYKILLQESAMREDGTVFSDKDVHRILERRGFVQLFSASDNNEWYNCGVDDVKAAIIELKTGKITEGRRTLDFRMRPEQEEAVKRSIEYFTHARYEEPDRVPKFLWNAKMRFGKTFASYQLAKKMGFKRILVLTFKPAVESAWSDDLLYHIDFDGWQFISNKDANNNKINIDEAYERCNKKKPIVVFGSFQDLLGTNENGGIKPKNEFIHEENWDLVILDEYHFGAWRENAKRLFEKPDEEKDVEFDIEKYRADEADNAYNETFLLITTKYYLYLSGTPFRAINSGEFIEDQIYNWTYSDEQKAKQEWNKPNNPYLPLPRMVMLTYRLPPDIRQIALQGEYNEFDLNVFFGAEGKDEDAKFKYKDEVQKWLDLIRGSHLPSNVDDLKLGQDKRPPMPFSDARLLNVLNHTVWFLPNVASCQAMYNLMQESQNKYYHGYKVIVAAGTKAGIGLDALYPVQRAMGNPLETRTITLTCGKLTTGVTIRPWSGIFMLRNLKSPETYFQAAFRVQSPWVVIDDNGKELIMKEECYIFDFALDRALQQISDYSIRLNVSESDPEKMVAEFISFLPVLAYDGSSMREINAQDVLDIAMAGTSATLLARRWESALLVNVDNDTLTRLLENQNAMDALMSIEGFRNLNNDIVAIINKSNAVKEAKKDPNALSEKEKRELTKEEKEFKSLRKQIQEKLIKFATRIPIFMYLTDYREKSLEDIIMQLEPGLFKKVTGLDVKDFDLLRSLGVFNANLMNDAIFKFKRYEDSSLVYTGVNKHEGKDVGGWDTVIKREEYDKLFYNQQATMVSFDDIYNDADLDDIEELQDQVPEPKIAEKPVVQPRGRIVLPQSSAQINFTANVEKVAKKQEEFEAPDISVGYKVTHKIFGEGEIIRFDGEKRLVVKFKLGEKNFTYPDVFKAGFLK